MGELPSVVVFARIKIHFRRNLEHEVAVVLLEGLRLAVNNLHVALRLGKSTQFN
jgi:hypothetical protein